MKQIILIFVMIVSITVLESYRTYTKPDVLLWSQDIKFESSDFKLVDKLPDNQLASVTTGIYLNYNYQGANIIRAYSAMVRSQSVMLKSLISDKIKLKEVLNHEKRHLDVAECVTRMLNSRLANIKDWRIANKIFSEYSIDTVAVYQKLYDTETEHFMNKEAQKDWNNKLDKILGLTKDSLTGIKLNPQ